MSDYKYTMHLFSFFLSLCVLQATKVAVGSLSEDFDDWSTDQFEFYLLEDLTSFRANNFWAMAIGCPCC